jgi:type I restriction enzyme S subunit
MSGWKEVPFAKLLVDSKDGEWGAGEEAIGLRETIIIRGTDFADLDNPTAEFPKRWIKDHLVERKKLRNGDIILETAGGTSTQSTGRSALLKKSFFQQHHDHPVLCASFSRHLRLDTKDYSPRFIFYLLQALYRHGYMAVFNIQHTGVSRFQYTAFKNHTELRIPDLPTQQKIAAILSAYDELIENNQQRIALLEKMAEEIYREWFIRLRFPGHKKVKLVKGVPEGWSIEPLGKLLSEVIDYRGVTPTKLNSNWEEVGITALSALNVKNGHLIRLEDAKKVSDTLYERWMRKKLQQFDILLTSEAPLGQVYMLMDSEKYVLSQRLFGLRVNPKRITPCYLYNYLLFPIGQHELTSRATGSTVGGIRQQLLRKVQVIMPTDDLLELHTNIVLPILESGFHLSKQNALLTKSRDTLLPRLISGKLSVENVDILFPPSMAEELKVEPPAAANA